MSKSYKLESPLFNSQHEDHFLFGRVKQSEVIIDGYYSLILRAGSLEIFVSSGEKMMERWEGYDGETRCAAVPAVRKMRNETKS